MVLGMMAGSWHQQPRRLAWIEECGELAREIFQVHGDYHSTELPYLACAMGGQIGRTEDLTAQRVPPVPLPGETG